MGSSGVREMEREVLGSVAGYSYFRTCFWRPGCRLLRLPDKGCCYSVCGRDWPPDSILLLSYTLEARLSFHSIRFHSVEPL